jgi:hypothetical protein
MSGKLLRRACQKLRVSPLKEKVGIDVYWHADRAVAVKGMVGMDETFGHQSTSDVASDPHTRLQPMDYERQGGVMHEAGGDDEGSPHPQALLPRLD